MANYIGNEPLAGEFKRLDSIESQFNGSLTSFNLLFNSLATSAGDASTLFVSLNGVIQEPIEAYTLTNGGSKIVFSSAPATGAECYIVQMGSVGGTATPSDASVTHGKFHTSVGAIVPSALGTAGQVLTVNSGATAATFADAGGGGGASEYTIDNKTAAYTVVSGDLGKILNYTSGTVDVTLTALSSLTTGFHVSIWNSGTGVLSIKPNSVDGIGVSAGNDYDSTDPLKLETGTGVTLVNSGTYWQIYSEKAYDYYHHSVTLGPNAKATNNYAMALGNRSSASSVGAIAIGTGQGHATTASNSHAVAIGRATASGSGSIALGTSYSSGADSFAAAITNNTASYGATGANSIAMGSSAKASQTDAIAIGKSAQATGISAVAISKNASATAHYSVAIGWTTAVSGTESAALAGRGALASGTRSLALGNFAKASAQDTIAISNEGSGYYTEASAIKAIAIGSRALSNIKGKLAVSNGAFSANGDSQTGTFVMRSDTTDATAEVITTNNSTADTTNQIVLPNNSCYGFTGTIIAREDSSVTNDFAVWEIKGGAVRAASASTTVLGTYNINKISESTGATNWSIALSADTTNGAVAITVTGEASHNIRWVATVNTTEVIY